MPKGDLRAGRALLPPPPHGTQFAATVRNFKFTSFISTSYSCEIYLAPPSLSSLGESAAPGVAAGTAIVPYQRERREGERG